MKRNLIIIVCLISVILVIFFNWFITNKNNISSVQKFNNEFLYYINGKISGVDLTTIINKAIDNNEKNKVLKNENGAYILNNENSIEVLIQVEPDGEFYLMEAFELSGMTSFTTLYGGIEFECIKTEYHENGRISKLIFEICETKDNDNITMNN